MTALHPQTHIRIARPVSDLTAAEHFYVNGLGLTTLYRAAATKPGEHDLVMVGIPGAPWHLELVGGAQLTTTPSPTAEDLLVFYLDGPVDRRLIERLLAAGGTQATSGPYWDRWGVTITDPDGYRYVLCTRSWHNTTAEDRIDVDAQATEGREAT